MTTPGILDFITKLGEVNEGKNDKETQKLVKKIVYAITNKKRQAWPDETLRYIFNKMSKEQQRWTLQVLKDINKDIEEAYKLIEGEKHDENRLV